MAFQRKTWVNRESEFPTRRKLTQIPTEPDTYTVTRAEGTVSVEGDAFDAENMNDLENRISRGFEETSALPLGGTTGMVLTKTGNTDSEVGWQTPKVSANNVTAGTLPSGVNISASQVTAGTLPTGVKASTASDYTMARLRNIKAGTSDLTAGSSSLANGEIYLVYE